MEKIICPNCGHEMLDKSVGGAVDVICPYCGNGWAAYEDQEKNALYSDGNKYQLFVDLTNPSVADLRFISEVIGMTMLNAKKLLDSKSALFFGKAYEVKPLLSRLKKAGYEFYTVPEFQHKI